MNEGCPDIDGNLLGWDFGQSKTDGCPEGWLLGMLDDVGIIDGFSLGCDDGCDVSKSETEGDSQEKLCGAALTDEYSEGIDSGTFVMNGASLCIELG